MQLRFLFLTFLLLLTAGTAHATMDECLNAYNLAQDDKVITLCTPLAERGSVDAESLLGLTYYGSAKYQDYKKAFEWLKKAAEAGQPTAQRQLGVMYYIGESVTQDRVQAEKWFRKAAERGEPEAQFELSLLYRLGEGGLPKDDSLAFTWAKRAAEQKSSNAQFALCQLYGKGTTEIQKDYHEAFNWCLKSAEQGNWAAQSLLGAIYGSRMLGESDFIAAYKWFFLADMNIKNRTSARTISDEVNKQIINEENKLGIYLEGKLSPEQIAEAKRQAEQWQADFDARKKKEGRIFSIK